MMKSEKWRKQFKEVVIAKCIFTKEGIINIEIENLLPIQVFSETVGLEGVLLLIKKESERYAEQNGRIFQMTSEELWAFLGINILIGINNSLT